MTPPALGWTMMAVVLATFVTWYIYQRSRPTRIVGLYIYPVKSCAGVPVASAEFGRLGLKHDREWMIVNAHTGQMATARELPQMVLITPVIDEAAQTLTLTYKNMPPLVVPIAPPKTDQNVVVWEVELKARRYGAKAAKWVTKALETSGPASPNAKPQEFCLVSLVSEKEHQRPVAEKHDWNSPDANIHTSFTDGYPFLLASQSSLALVNTWTRPTRNMEMLAFRPNIIIDGGRLTPFEEDYWRTVQIGSQKDNRFWVTKPCERCILTTVVPSKGERHPSGTFTIRLDTTCLCESLFLELVLMQLCCLCPPR